MNRCPNCTRSFVDTQEVCPLDDARLVPFGGDAPAGLGRTFGTYRVIGLLGEGGMGSIYIGAHTRLSRHVAIKVLRPELANRKDAVARFFDEARTVNSLRHPNIVESIDMVEDVVDGVYCVMELLRGPDLKTRLLAGPLPVATAIDIAAQIADALAAVHAKGIVHRDLKPENLILVDHDGRGDFVKLIDFGVAQIDTTAGGPIGTAAYMAPEQAAGERVDGRADLYSLGVLLFEMVTGKHPLPSATDGEYILRHADDVPPKASKIARGTAIPPALDAAIARCLAKRPANRFASATELALALRTIALRPQRSAWKWLGGGLALAGAAAAAVLLIPDLLATDQAAQAQPFPAPAPAADLVVPPRAPDKDVLLKFSSDPSGARVYRPGETVPLGTTPFVTTMPRTSQPLHVTLELAGHEVAEREISLAEPGELTVTLVPVSVPAKPDAVKRPAPGKREPKKPGVQREGVMDPFAPRAR
ncbi:MAG TPA: serine/threonine-protein kinase [Kofleriaceae bacterium]